MKNKKQTASAYYFCGFIMVVCALTNFRNPDNYKFGMICFALAAINIGLGLLFSKKAKEEANRGKKTKVNPYKNKSKNKSKAPKVKPEPPKQEKKVQAKKLKK